MKRSEVLRLAAHHVENNGGFACCVLMDHFSRSCERIPQFQLLRPTYAERSFRPDRDGLALVEHGMAWWDLSKAGQDARVLGLCLAAAIAESEGQ